MLFGPTIHRGYLTTIDGYFSFMVSRRIVLAAGGGVAALAPIGFALDASADDAPADSGRPVPRTLVRRSRRASGGRTVSKTEFPLTHLGVAWTAAKATVRVRTAAGWSDWRPARGCVTGSDSADTDRPGGNALLAVAGATGYEVQVDGGSVSTVELNTHDGPRRTTTAASREFPHGARKGYRMPRYLPRAGWGADESRRVTTTPLSFHTPVTLTVHHEGAAYDSTRQLEHVRALYEFETTPAAEGGAGLDDLGYHMLIDTAGTVYEGRWSGDDRVPVFGPGFGKRKPQMVNGAHLAGFNAGNIGVCLLGDYSTAPVPKAVYRSLTLVLAGLAAVARLDPRGTTRYVNQADLADPTRTDPPRTATVRTISAHRDWHEANPQAGETLCPGDGMSLRMEALRKDVATVLKRWS
jgi:hypothetical protein